MQVYLIIALIHLVYLIYAGGFLSKHFKEGIAYKKIKDILDGYPLIKESWYGGIVALSMILSSLIWPMTIISLIFKKKT